MSSSHDMPAVEIPPMTDAVRAEAMVLAMSIRNALEGTLHGGEAGELSLTDEQMARLNPLVRNGVATALHARAHYLTAKAARSYLDFQAMLVPDYWEPPELLEDYVELWMAQVGRPDDLVCRRCGRAVVDLGGKWTHINAAGGLNVGCRAASFTAGAGWDDNIPRTWTAAPKTT